MKDDSYKKAREDVQRRADETGYDHALTWNPLTQEWNSWTLPQRQNRYGFDLQVEVVHPMDLKKCQPGHGPLA